MSPELGWGTFGVIDQPQEALLVQIGKEQRMRLRTFDAKGKRIAAGHYNGASLWFVNSKEDKPRILPSVAILADGGWSVRGVVKNIANQHYSPAIAYGSVAGVSRFVPRDNDRFFGVIGSVNF